MGDRYFVKEKNVPYNVTVQRLIRAVKYTRNPKWIDWYFVYISTEANEKLNNLPWMVYSHCDAWIKYHFSDTVCHWQSSLFAWRMVWRGWSMISDWMEHLDHSKWTGLFRESPWWKYIEHKRTLANSISYGSGVQFWAIWLIILAGLIQLVMMIYTINFGKISISLNTVSGNE